MFLNISAKSLYLPKTHKLIYFAKYISCHSLFSISLIFVCIFIYLCDFALTNKCFCMCLQVTTVDRFQGQQNDYIILSLVRTKAVGHLR